MHLLRTSAEAAATATIHRVAIIYANVRSEKKTRRKMSNMLRPQIPRAFVRQSF